MTADEISRMDYKQLRNTVIELNDNYIKLKRALDDTLNNLDTSNLATTFRKELNGYKSEFKITAEEISSKVSHIEKGLEQYSTIKQTADKIEMAVNESREYTDGQTQQLSSTFTMTAGQISTNVVKVKNKTDKNYSSIVQTAESIDSIVCKVIGSSFNKSEMPTKGNTTDAEKQKVCIVTSGKDKGQYYWNSILEEWLEYDSEGVKTAFTQTAEGFLLNGCVTVTGKIDMKKDAVIGQNLILQDKTQSSSYWEAAGTINVTREYLNIIAESGRHTFISGTSVTLSDGHGNTLVLDGGGLKYNGRQVLTE